MADQKSIFDAFSNSDSSASPNPEPSSPSVSQTPSPTSQSDSGGSIFSAFSQPKQTQTLQSIPSPDLQRPENGQKSGSIFSAFEAETINQPEKQNIVQGGGEPSNPDDPWYKKAWNAVNEPLFDETTAKNWFGWDVHSWGGLGQGFFDLMSGLTSPLQLALTIGTFGSSSLLDAGGVAALKTAGWAAKDIEAVVNGSTMATKLIKAGHDSDLVWKGLASSGFDVQKISEGLDVIKASGLTPESLVANGVIRRAGSSALRQAGMDIGMAENVGAWTQAAIDAGFTVQNAYAAAITSPRVFDAIKEGDYETAKKLAVEAAGMGLFAGLGAHQAVSHAGELMPETAAKMGLRVKPSEENLKLIKQFEIYDRENIMNSESQKQWEKATREQFKDLSKDDMQRGRFYYESGSDKNDLAKWYNAVSDSAGRTDKRTTIPENVAYRIRDLDEQGVPTAQQHAHASMSEAEVRGYAPHRSNGGPQEIVSFDLDKLKDTDYEIKKGPNGHDWVELKRPLTESELNNHGDAFQPTKQKGQGPFTFTDNPFQESIDKLKLKEKPAEYIDRLLDQLDPDKLTDRHVEFSKEISNRFIKTLEKAQVAGALSEGAGNYITRIFKDPENDTVRRFRTTAQGSGFSTYTVMARKRIFGTTLEGLLNGHELADYDPIALATHNGNEFGRVANTRDALERLRGEGIRASDGRPMVALSGSGHAMLDEKGNRIGTAVQPSRAQSLRITKKIVEGLQNNIVKQGEQSKFGEYKYNPISGDSPVSRRFFHGTKANFKDISEANPETFSHVGARYGLGLYMTDNPHVAEGYSVTKGLGEKGTVHAADLSNAKMLHLDKTFPPEVQKIFDKIEISYGDGPSDRSASTGKEVFNKLKEDMADAQLTTNDALDIYEDLVISLKKAGYDGFLHMGGDTGRGGKGPHNVSIIFPTYDSANPISKLVKPAVQEPVVTKPAITELDKLLKEGRVTKFGVDKKTGEQLYAWTTHDYRDVTNPSFKGWGVPTQDSEGHPLYLESDLKAHPEAHEYLNRRFGTNESIVSKIPGMKTLLKAGQEAKGILLFGSPFHAVQEGLRALMTGISPFSAPEFDPGNAMHRLAAEKGVWEGKEYKGAQAFQEGLAGHSKLISKIPGLAQIQDWQQKLLFDRYIPGLKLRAFEKLNERYAKAYPDWSVDKVANVAATDTANRFGGIPYKRIGRAAGTMDAARIMALAPDWLESEMRFMGSLFGEGGKITRRDTAKMAVGLWTVSRVLNALVNNGNTHNEAPFGVAVKGDDGREKVYSIRSMPGDILHLASDPEGFLRGRISPIVRTGIQTYTGRDEFGRKLPEHGLWVNALRNISPIGIQSTVKKVTGEDPGVTAVDAAAKATGFTVYNYRSEAQKLAGQIASDHTSSGPVNPEKMRRHSAVLRLEDQIRSGQAPMTTIHELVETGQLHRDEAKSIEKNVKETKDMDQDMARLYMHASRLPFPDFIKVWEAAGNSEKTTLVRLLLSKKQTFIKNASKNMSPAERLSDPSYKWVRTHFPQEAPY